MAIVIRTLPHRTFNKHDCNVTTVEGRFDVEVDMSRRMGLVVKALARAPKGFRDTQSLADHLNKRLGSSYSDRDMMTTLTKLRKAGIVSKSAGWRLTPTGAQKFESAKILKRN